MVGKQLTVQDMPNYRVYPQETKISSFFPSVPLLLTDLRRACLAPGAVPHTSNRRAMKFSHPLLAVFNPRLAQV